MDTVHKGFRVLGRYSVEFSAGGDELGYCFVSQEHKLLDEPVGILRNLFVNPDRTAFFVALDLHLRTIEVEGSVFLLVLLEYLGEAVEHHYGFFEAVRPLGVDALGFFDYLLGSVVVVTVVGTDDGATYPA